MSDKLTCLNTEESLALLNAEDRATVSELLERSKLYFKPTPAESVPMRDIGAVTESAKSVTGLTQTAFKKFDSDKLDMSLLPEEALEEIVRVLMSGAKKYGKFNWVENSEGANWSRFTNALERHLKKFKSGVNFDEETRLHEIAHVATNALFLLTYQLLDLGNDDRDFRIGKTFNNIKCLEFVDKQVSMRWYKFECGHCGAVFTALYNNVQKGNTKSCGCLHYTGDGSRTHGMSKEPIYLRWRGILNRCNDENSISYPNYGGRGIKVCERWMKFDNFFEDMGLPPNELSQIDRIDNDGDYEPTNCQWLDRLDNIRKQNRVSKYYFNGGNYTLNELAEMHNIPSKCVRKRIRMGWELHEALNTPSRKNKPEFDDRYKGGADPQ